MRAPKVFVSHRPVGICFPGCRQSDIQCGLYMHARAHTHTHTHTHTLTQIHECMHTHMHAHTYTHTVHAHI